MSQKFQGENWDNSNHPEAFEATLFAGSVVYSDEEDGVKRSNHTDRGRDSCKGNLKDDVSDVNHVSDDNDVSDVEMMEIDEVVAEITQFRNSSPSHSTHIGDSPAGDIQISN